MNHLRISWHADKSSSFRIQMLFYLLSRMGTRDYFTGGKAAGAWRWPPTSI